MPRKIIRTKKIEDDTRYIRAFAWVFIISMVFVSGFLTGILYCYTNIC